MEKDNSVAKRSELANLKIAKLLVRNVASLEKQFNGKQHQNVFGLNLKIINKEIVV